MVRRTLLVAVGLVGLALMGLSRAEPDQDLKQSDADRKLQEEYQQLLNFKSGRDLTAREAVQLMEWVLVLVNKDKSPWERRIAARKIEEKLPHKAAIPALAQVLRDPKDDETIRKCVLESLGYIDDRSVVPLMIEALGTPRIAGAADEMLFKVAGWQRPHKVAVSWNATPKDFETAIEAWKDWWKKNEATYKYERWRVLYDF